MKRFIAVFLTVAAIGAATPVFAQDAAPGPGKVVITIIPGGATFFTEAEDNPNTGSFGNYDLGGAVAVNFNRYVGVEGEISAGLGVEQTIELGRAYRGTALQTFGLCALSRGDLGTAIASFEESAALLESPAPTGRSPPRASATPRNMRSRRRSSRATPTT